VSLIGIELLEEEFVVQRGTAAVHWFVRHNDSWLNCQHYAGARATTLDAGAGTVYRTRVELDVPTGTRLMRVESRPGRPARRSAVEHLLRAVQSTPRDTRRTYYAVGPRGALREVR
jgi:hypothetical protein